ncbi:unnamed protein product [Lasius platythorax]|uniref:mevalonate kinase n=1 Tax=Lasius platythorax TaxID=488582 RepID=A0AAV2NIZ1_9HYME
MIEFKISAPGRIVLSGKHAAMYGKPVVMASIDRYTTVKFSELNDGPREIKIEFPDVALSLNVSLEQVLNFFSCNNSFDMTLDHCRLLRLVQSWITLNGMWSTQEQRFSLQTFFFLLFIIAYDKKFVIKSFHVHVSTQLPIGAGLGSSSSFAVCLAACFIHWARLQNGANYAFNEQELTSISNYAMYCERISQNYMFGADNYVCSYGKTIKSRYEQDSYYNDIINMPTMKILLIDTNIRQNKDERATQIAELKHSRPDFVDLNLRTYNISSTNICKKLVAMNNINQEDNIPIHEIQMSVYQQLQTLIYVDQLIVQNLGLSHPSIDMIGSISRDLGCWENPTDFGGLVYILLPPIIPEEIFGNLERHLREMGFNIMVASVCCSGVRIDD